jgi:hypothetical protein
MSTEEAHFRLRLPADIHAELTKLADKNQRSINAEVVARLRASLRWDAHDPDQVAVDLREFDRRIDKLEFELSRVLSHVGLDEWVDTGIKHFSENAAARPNKQQLKK